ncbi:hypothetical protein Tco_1287568 [Tanacetum coccineum]
MLPTSGELKAYWWVRSQYYFKREDAPFIQPVKPKCIDLQRCDSKVVDYVNVVEEDCTLVEQTKKPSCSTLDQVDAVINQGVPLVQQTPHVLRNVGSSYKGLIEPKIIDTVDLLCKQLIYVRPEMEGMFDKLKSKVIDTLTTTLESVRNHAEVVEAEVVNCETNLVECPLVEKDVGVLRVAVDSCDMNLVYCPVVHKENLEPKHFTFTDTQPSTMEHLVNAYAFVSPPFPFYDSPKADKCVEPAQDTNDTDGDYMDFDNKPSQYCLDNMSIGIEKDTQNGELTVTLKRLEQCESVLMSAPPGWKVDWQAPLVGVVVDLVDHHCKDVSGVMRCVVCWRKANRVSGGTVLVCPGLMVLIVLCADLIGTPELDESCEDCDQGDVLRTYFQIHTWGGGWAGGDQDTTLEGMVGGCDVIIILYDEGGGGAVLGFWFKGSGMVLGGVKAGALLWEWVIIWGGDKGKKIKKIANENSNFDTLLKDGNMNLDKLIADVTKFENKFLQMIKASEVNVVKGDGKPVLGKVFEAIGRIKKPEIFKQALYMQQRPKTPQVKKKRKSFNLKPFDFPLSTPSKLDGSQETLQPFKEVLRRLCKSNPNKVTVPTCMKCFLRNSVGPKQMYKFP